MKGLFLAVTAVMALASGFVSAEHDAVLKSFNSVSGECSRLLLNDGNGDCNIRCIGLVLKNWNDTVARFTYNYAYFFKPDPEDQCYKNRTERCLDQVYSTVPVYNKCLRAQLAGQCHADQYGKLDASNVHYVPMTNLQYTRVLLQCADVLGFTYDDMNKVICQGGYNTPEGALLLRCTLIRMGLWSDDKGIDLGRATVQCGLYGDSEPILACQAKVLAEECDKAVQVKRVAQECLNMHYNVFRQANGDVGVQLYYFPCYLYPFFPCPYNYINVNSFQNSGSNSYAVSSSSQNQGFNVVISG